MDISFNVTSFSHDAMSIYIMGEQVTLNEMFIYIMGEEVTLNEMFIYIMGERSYIK
jgi:hypothetical protein